MRRDAPFIANWMYWCQRCHVTFMIMNTVEPNYNPFCSKCGCNTYTTEYDPDENRTPIQFTKKEE